MSALPAGGMHECMRAAVCCKHHTFYSPMQIISRADAIAAIRRDYDSKYFVSGRGFGSFYRPVPMLYLATVWYHVMLLDMHAGEMDAYEPDCLFADPFAGFNGVERFQKNVSNLGGLMWAAIPILMHAACRIARAQRARGSARSTSGRAWHGQQKSSIQRHPNMQGGHQA